MTIETALGDPLERVYLPRLLKLNPYPRKGEADLPSALLFHLKQSLKTKIV
jgi:hypothetical protein